MVFPGTSATSVATTQAASQVTQKILGSDTGPTELIRRNTNRNERQNLAKVERDEMREQRKLIAQTAKKVFEMATAEEEDSSGDDKDVTKWPLQQKSHIRSKKQILQEFNHGVSLLQEQTEQLNIDTEKFENIVDSSIKQEAKSKSGWTWWR